jgi:hypothetical protein
MSKKSPLPQSRRHVMLYDEDWDWLQAEFGQKIGVGAAIKVIVHRKVQDMKAKANEAFDRIRDEMRDGSDER